MAVNFEGKEISQIISEGIQHQDDRWKLHALYEEALENQQAVREYLRSEARKALGRHLKKRDAEKKGQPEGSFSKNPEVRMEYRSGSHFGIGPTSGYYVSYQGRELFISYSATEGVVGAYLLTLGLSDSEIKQGAKI